MTVQSFASTDFERAQRARILSEARHFTGARLRTDAAIGSPRQYRARALRLMASFRHARPSSCRHRGPAGSSPSMSESRTATSSRLAAQCNGVSRALSACRARRVRWRQPRTSASDQQPARRSESGRASPSLGGAVSAPRRCGQPLELRECRVRSQLLRYGVEITTVSRCHDCRVSFSTSSPTLSGT